MRRTLKSVKLYYLSHELKTSRAAGCLLAALKSRQANSNHRRGEAASVAEFRDFNNIPTASPHVALTGTGAAAGRTGVDRSGQEWTPLPHRQLAGEIRN